jgi:uncharacterized protein YggE
VAGVDLGDVVSIQESVATPPAVAADMAYATAAGKATSPVPIASGAQDVVVTVNVVFDIS